MNDKFDELAKSLAQSVTRRGALKKFGLGLVGIALVLLGLANKAKADPRRKVCDCSAEPTWGCKPNQTGCIKYCGHLCNG